MSLVNDSLKFTTSDTQICSDFYSGECVVPHGPLVFFFGGGGGLTRHGPYIFIFSSLGAYRIVGHQ